MKKTTSLLLVVALIAGMFAAFAIPAFATADHALPTTYNGKTIDWSVSGKLGTLMGDGNYYADLPTAYAALYNLYHQAPVADSAYADASFDGLANTVDVWTADDGFFEGQGVVWNENAAAWPKVLAGEALIAGLTAEQKAAADDEIAYFAFVAGKVKEFTIDLNSNDTWHQGIDVIGFIVADAVQAIEDATTPAVVLPTLPATYNGNTIDWSVSGKLGTLMGDGNYYADLPTAYAALYNLYHQAPVADSAYADASFDGLANTVDVWTADDGFFEGQGVVWNENAAAWPKVLAGEALIAGLTDEQKTAAADEIAYFAFVAGKVKEFTIDLNSNDIWHQGIDVIGFIVADAVQAIEDATTPAHTHAYGDWQSDATNHWKVCDCGDKIEEAAHIYADDADTTCEACGYTRIFEEPANPDYVLPTQYNGKTLDWTDYINTGSKDKKKIQQYYNETLGWGEFGDSQAFYNMLYGWDSADTGYADLTWFEENLNVPSQDINSAAPYYVIQAGEAYIQGLSAELRGKAEAKKAIGDFRALSAKAKSMACSIYFDKVTLTFDVIDDLLRDAIAAIETATSAPEHQHNFVAVNEVPADCTTAGTRAHFKCDGCDALFTAEDAATQIADPTTLVIDALGHDFATAWTHDETKHWHVCSRCNAVSEDAAHTAGLDTCDVCGYAKPQNPNTGDYNSMILWVALILVSCGAMAMALAIKKRNTVKE